MYLQKQLSKRIGDKEYAKYVLVIPPKVIHQLKWKGGEKLELEIKNDKLIVKRD
ncbi:AbrB/MazE/SpoVT family DNA-binding domain-containing protein [Candidatus Woesearchaeota archaeon]|nr:AbrB/MazE/SpoVT family DNA-binding domain-containing protein [Candidatus Woesearchaeota archaeon]